MKSIFKNALYLGIILSFIGFGHLANAVEDGRVNSFLFTCNISFSAKGKSAYFLLGYTNIKGTGFLNCYDYAQNRVEKIPIDVVVRGPGAGLGVTGMNISGSAIGIGINESPETLLGDYLAVRGNAAVGIGAGAGANLRVAKGAFDIGISISGESGLGAGIDLLSVKLSRSSSAKVESLEIVSEAKLKEVSVVKERVLQVRDGEFIDVVDVSGRKIKRLQIRVR